jgi:hypothetical protein
VQPSLTPVVSVVVGVVSDTVGSRADTRHLKPCLAALQRQVGVPPPQIIVPFTRNLTGVEALRSEFPSVQFLECPDISVGPEGHGSREHHDQLRARGIAAASGEIIAMLEDHGVADASWLAAIVEAHKQPAAVVGGAVENGVDTALNWAVYFCDFFKYQNPVPEGESFYASDANVSYKRRALETVREVWQNRFQEIDVNAVLVSRGERIVLSREMRLEQRRHNLTLPSAIQERFIWGRSYAASRSASAPIGKRMIWALSSPLLPALLLFRIGSVTFLRGKVTGAFLRCSPVLAILLMSWSWGELTGYVTHSSGDA